VADAPVGALAAASDVASRAEPQGPPIPEPLTAPDALNLPPLPMVPKPAAVASAQTTPADTGPIAATPVAAEIPADLANAVPAAAASSADALPPVPAGIGNADFLAAVEARDPKALFEVGLRLLEGRSGASDPVAAMTWFTAAAERGFAPAQYSVGTLYEKGNGVERDLAAARTWYEQSAEQGNIRAMHNLAVLYATGVDGTGDPKQAAEWFLQAAEHGMRDSQYNLGILYARGAGLERDLGESYRWFSIVAKSGDQDAKAKGDELAKSLAPDLRARIDAEVAAWAPQERIDAANAVEIPANWSDKTDQTASIDTSRAIRNVQAILIKLGYDPGTPDGIVGAQTTQAIRAFQKNAGLTETGKIDEPLIRALLQRKDA
jgi:localization factor PodJL